jgi:mannan endo-1,4-beta-mannosidase
MTMTPDRWSSRLSNLIPMLSIPMLVLIISSAAQAQTPYRVLNYLYSIRGTKTVSGQHNREPNSNPSQWTAEIFNTTGRYPGLWSGDFLFQADNIANRSTMIDQAITEWSHGAIVNLMWHACSPALSEPCDWDSNGVLSHMSDEQWNELLTDGTPINTTWKSRMDAVAVHLQRLKDAGVEVLFRPLHEMNQGAFWWGGRPGPNGTARLYQITRDYFRNTKGLTNLIWVWDLQDFGSLSDDISSYHPGSDNFDLFALDIYEGNTQTKYELAQIASGGKPFGIGECATLPTVSQLEAQPNWAFFMGWAELVFSENSTTAIQNLYTASSVVTLEEMPGWNSLPLPPILPGAWYTIVNRNGNKCVDARASGTFNGAVIQQYTCNNTYAQQFQFTRKPGGYYRVVNRNNRSQALDVVGGVGAIGNGVPIQLWRKNGQASQQWLLVPEGGGFFHFVARHSGRCLDVPGSSAEDSLQLQQWDCNGTGAQSFRLVLQH